MIKKILGKEKLVEQRKTKIIPLEKWRELLKLLEKRPSHKWMYNNLDKIEVVEMYFQKIEEKLKELQK